MSSYKTISTYSSGWDSGAAIKSPVMLYQNTPLKPELVPSYGTVGYSSATGTTYRGYSSLCGGYSDKEGIGCGLSDPSDPCFEEGPQTPSTACMSIAQRVVDKLNLYKIPQEVILKNPPPGWLTEEDIKEGREKYFPVLNTVLFEVISLLYKEIDCVNANITGQADLLADTVVNGLVALNELVPHAFDSKSNFPPNSPENQPYIYRGDQFFYKLVFQPNLMEYIALPLPVNEPVLGSKNSKKGGGLFNMFRKK